MNILIVLLTILTLYHPIKGFSLEGTNFSNHTILVDTELSKDNLFVEDRKSKISRFECSKCHKDKSETEKILINNIHDDINLSHGSLDKGTQFSCFVCHNSTDIDYLNYEVDKQLDINHSYKLCGQCHFRQRGDWEKGAHGKRVFKWSGSKIIKNCTDCHNPHSPRFEIRWPKTYSRP